jgi:hypothetical protein
MRYFVKNPRGEELTCPTLGDLAALYAQGFLEDDDLVRAERSQRWVRAGDLPALRGLRERRREPWKVSALMAAAMLLALALALLLGRR